MSAGVSVLVVAVVGAIAFGLFRAVTDGRFRGTHKVHGAEDAATPTPAQGEPAPQSLLEGTRWADDLGERATLVQFSTVFCQPCRATRRVLAGVAQDVAGVAHVEIDAESRLDLVRRLDLRRTPTVLVLDAAGRIVRRASGQPRTADVVAALGKAISA